MFTFERIVFSSDSSVFFAGVYVKKAHLILRGHRSIVNQVRYNHHSGIIISSGVEKIIKVTQHVSCPCHQVCQEAVGFRACSSNTHTHRHALVYMHTCDITHTHICTHASIDTHAIMHACTYACTQSGFHCVCLVQSLCSVYAWCCSSLILGTDMHG